MTARKAAVPTAAVTKPRRRPPAKTRKGPVVAAVIVKPATAVDAHEDDAALGRMLRQAEGNVVALLHTVLSVSAACLPLAQRLKASIENDKAMTVRDQMLVLTRWGNLVQKCVDAARDVAEIKRSLLGEAATRAEAAAPDKTEDDTELSFRAALAELARPGDGYRVRRGLPLLPAASEDDADDGAGHEEGD